MSTPHHVPTRRLKDAGWLTVLPLLLNAISFFANGYIIRSLGESGYGTLVVALGLSGATVMLSNMGMRALYTKAVAGANNETTSRLLAEQMGLRLLLGIGFGCLAPIAAVLLYPGNSMLLLCTILQVCGVLLMISWTPLADVLNARELFAENAKIAFYAGLSLTAASVVAVAMGGGPVAVASAYLVGPAINLAMHWTAVRNLGIPIKVGGATWTRYRHLLRNARALAANDILATVQHRAQGVWAPLLFGISPMGVYDAGTMPMSRLEMASDGVATAYFPAMASAHTRGEDSELERQALGMFTLILVVALPLAVFIWFGAPYITRYFFPSPDQVDSAALCLFVTRLTAFAVPISATGVGMRYALQAAALHSRNAKDQMTATLLGSGVALALALTVGIKGLAIAILARTVLVRLIQGRTFQRRFPTLRGRIPWLRLAFAAATPATLLVLGLGMAGETGFLRAGVVASVAGISYVFVVVLMGLVEKPGRRVQA